MKTLVGTFKGNDYYITKVNNEAVIISDNNTIDIIDFLGSFLGISADEYESEKADSEEEYASSELSLTWEEKLNVIKIIKPYF